MFNTIPRKLATGLIVNIWNWQTAKRKKNLLGQHPDIPTSAVASGPWIQVWPPTPAPQLCCVSPLSEPVTLIYSLHYTGWSKEHRLTFQSGVLVNPVTNDGSQDQNRACHHQPIDSRQQEAVPIEFHQKHGHCEVPHPIPLKQEKDV